MIGRNDPCVCGSGKKYKRCCLSSRPSIRRADEMSAEEQDEVFGGDGFSWPDEPALQRIARGSGWSIAKLRLLRSRGARYSAKRKTFVYWAPSLYSDHPTIGDPSDPFDAYLCKVNDFNSCGVLAEISTVTGAVSTYLDPCHGGPSDAPMTHFQTVSCTEAECSFRVRVETLISDDSPTVIVHDEEPVTCQECAWTGHHHYVLSLPTSAAIRGCPQCGDVLDGRSAQPALLGRDADHCGHNHA